MRKHDTWLFVVFAVYQWSVILSPIGPHLPLWLNRLDFATACDLTRSITHVEGSSYWPAASRLLCGACFVFWWWTVSDVDPRQVLFWSWLFPLLSRFCQRTVAQAQLAGAWEEWIQSAQSVWRGPGGSSRVGRMRKMEGELGPSDSYVMLKLN